MTIDQFIAILKNPNQQVLHRHLYHFTDTQNLPLIERHGLLSAKEIAGNDVAVPVFGGNQWSQDADKACGMD